MPSLAGRIEPLVERIEAAEGLDAAASKIAGTVARARPPSAAGLLAGTWLGHPLHPVLTDLPIGCWTSAWCLDFIGGRQSRRAAQALVGLGVVTAVPTAITGLSDWADTEGETRRIGLVHATVNSVGLLCYALSWLSRRRGRHGMGVMLGMLGATAVTAGAHLGGHLVYRRGIGVDVNASAEVPDTWEDVARARTAGLPARRSWVTPATSPCW